MPLWQAFAAVLCVYLAIAAVYTHPVLQYSHDRIANDPYDPILNTSILWWNATTVPFTEAWWSPPHFYPAKDVAAFTENLVGISVFASPIFWLTGGNALAAYNLSFFLTWPLSAFTAYLLAFVADAPARRRVPRRPVVRIHARTGPPSSGTCRCCRRSGFRSAWWRCTVFSRRDAAAGSCCLPRRGFFRRSPTATSSSSARSSSACGCCTSARPRRRGGPCRRSP